MATIRPGTVAVARTVGVIMLILLVVLLLLPLGFGMAMAGLCSPGHANACPVGVGVCFALVASIVVALITLTGMVRATAPPIPLRLFATPLDRPPRFA